ncbi:transglycosylase SLT domain-containing protein [Rudaea sp.]|uniref:transglycosylase SLT domain-containing protein n=1 Tax=Rudaea sp. TaxID=2136325 RepID=UPI003783C470
MPIFDLYATCGPWVHPDTLRAVAVVESHAHPWAIGTPQGAIFPHTRSDAERQLARALRTEPSVDVGLLQINSQWFPRLHLAPASLLDPCVNVRVGAAILAANFVAASRPGRSHLHALVAALSAYNSGSETAAVTYAEKVLSAGASMRKSR